MISYVGLDVDVLLVALRDAMISAWNGLLFIQKLPNAYNNNCV